MDTSRPLTRNSASAPRLPFSIRVLRRIQPLIAALLGSPLHGMLSRDVLLLTYDGRRTGRAYTLPLSYVELDGNLYLCGRPDGSRWWRNLRGGVRVRLMLRGRRVEAAASVLDTASDEAREGLRAFVSHNPRTGAMLYGMDYDAQRRPLEDVLRREVRRSVVVRLELDRDV